MASITRKLGEYLATLYEVGRGDEGKLTTYPVATVNYIATTADERHARAEFRAQGYDVPHKAYITVDHVRTHKYTATLEAFLSVATDSIVEE